MDFPSRKLRRSAEPRGTRKTRDTRPGQAASRGAFLLLAGFVKQFRYRAAFMDAFRELVKVGPWVECWARTSVTSTGRGGRAGSREGLREPGRQHENGFSAGVAAAFAARRWGHGATGVVRADDQPPRVVEGHFSPRTAPGRGWGGSEGWFLVVGGFFLWRASPSGELRLHPGTRSGLSCCAQRGVLGSSPTRLLRPARRGRRPGSEAVARTLVARMTPKAAGPFTRGRKKPDADVKDQDEGRDVALIMYTSGTTGAEGAMLHQSKKRLKQVDHRRSEFGRSPANETTRVR